MASFDLRSDAFGKLLLRLAVGGLMLFHGVSKILHGIGWLVEMLPHRGIPGFVGYGVYLAEVIAPVMMIVGLRARLAALVVAFEMVIATWLAHSQNILTIKEAGGGWSIELEAFFFFGSLALFFMGAGKIALSGGSGAWE